MMAHLYAATKLLDPTSPRWPDMEFLIYSQGADRLFFGGTPKTLDESHRKSRLMVGQSARAGKQVKLTDGRWIQDTSVVAPIFTKRTTWATTDESVDTEVNHLNNKLRSPADLALLARKLGMSTESLEYELQARRWRPYIEEQMNNENGPTALLRDLSTWLDGEAVDLHLSWQALHDQCAQVWKRLVRSLLDDPDWDNRLSITPGLGVHILENAANAEKEWGSIAADDSNFAAPLRKTLEAIQATIFEERVDEATALGIFAVDHKAKESTVRGGDVCITRLMTEAKDFWRILCSSSHKSKNLFLFYENWDPAAIAGTRVLYKINELTEALEDKARREWRHKGGFWVEKEQKWLRYDGDDLVSEDGCANCPRCRRRNYLGHRYPGSYKPHHDDDGHDHFDNHEP